MHWFYRPAVIPLTSASGGSCGSGTRTRVVGLMRPCWNLSSPPRKNSGRDRTRTCKGLRLARIATGCHRASWLALPTLWPETQNSKLKTRNSYSRAVPVGFEPTPVWLTASRTTVVLRDNTSTTCSILGGIRTRDLRLERPAATPQAPRGLMPCTTRTSNPPRRFTVFSQSHRIIRNCLRFALALIRPWTTPPTRSIWHEDGFLARCLSCRHHAIP